ncbi:MAG: hypothetical protein SOZ59_07675 [Candidatus Limivivens sp.]|nr:hypothetical protein [Candidatus Limivivens sp.]
MREVVDEPTEPDAGDDPTESSAVDDPIVPGETNGAEETSVA